MTSKSGMEKAMKMTTSVEEEMLRGRLRVWVQITLPNGKTHEVQHEVPHQYKEILEAFGPLPRDREFPWAFESRAIAEGQIQLRKMVKKEIALAISGSIAQALKKQDPVNGYDPDEVSIGKPSD